MLEFNRGIIIRLLGIGVPPNDWQYMQLYADYVRLMREGNKKTYVVAELADRYELSERKVYALIKAMETTVPTMQ